MKASDLIEADDGVVLSGPLQRLALNALCEICILCELLRTATRNAEDEEMFVVRGLTSRMNDLVDAVTSAISDPHAQADDIAARVQIALPAQDGDA